MGAAWLCVLLALPVRAELPQDAKALAALTRKALRLGERTLVPTAHAAVFGEIAEANLPKGAAPLEGGLRSFREKKGEDGFEGNMLGFAMETAMQPAMRQMDAALAAASAGTKSQTLNLARTPAHMPALALQKPSTDAARVFYALADRTGPAAKPVRLVFRVTRAKPGSMDWKKGTYDHTLGTSATCWYVADPDGRLREALFFADDGSGKVQEKRDPPECRGYCAELEAWTGAGCLAGEGWLEPGAGKGE